jgi:hypothetical protein
MRDLESNDLEGAVHLAAMEEDYHPHPPSPSEYHGLGDLSTPERVALAQVHQKQLRGNR